LDKNSNIKYESLKGKINAKSYFYKSVFFDSLIPILFLCLTIHVFNEFSIENVFIILILNILLFTIFFIQMDRNEILDITLNFDENSILINYFDIFNGPKINLTIFKFKEFTVHEEYLRGGMPDKTIVITYNKIKYEFKEINYGKEKFEEFRFEIRNYCSNKVENGWRDYKLFEW
jgi:hypothetical protein